MPLIVFHSRRLRTALAAPAALGTELFVLLGVGGILGGLILMARQASSPMHEQVNISLSLRALPVYTTFTLLRGFAAYVLSLAFTLVYGTYAAHHKRAERIMVPAIDVLQAIPVLGFLPGLVLALVHLFPTREIGLELACIIMLFTGQVWNMTFSFFGSLRGIPTTLREAAAVQRLRGFQVFRLLEVPASMIGLVWNSMMSMAGGWFFITVTEAFTLRDRDYRLPGLGSYMNEAILQHNHNAEIGAVIAMVLMIVIVDQIFWRPIVVWSERFKLEDVAATDAPQSWVMDLFRRSKLLLWTRWLWRKRPSLSKVLPMRSSPRPVVLEPKPNPLLPIVRWVIFTAIGVAAAWGAWQLAKLLWELPVHTASGQDWIHVLLALGASFLRTSAAVLLGALWTLPVGILIGRSPKWSQRLQPVVQVVASFPAPMLFPIVTALLLMLHVPFTLGCVALMLLGTQWYVLFNVIAGAMAIPSELGEASRVYRLSAWLRWTRLYIPAVFPYLVTGLVTAAGGAWNATIISEFVQTGPGNTLVAFGLGSTISEATASGNFPLLAAGIITMAVFVVGVNRVLWKRLYRLAETRYSVAM